MKYTRVDRIKEFKISAMGIGTWAFDPKGWTGTTDKQSIEILKKAIKMGINFIDTAPVYGLGHSEKIVGEAIKGFDREKIFIATKCGLIWNDKGDVENNLSRESLLKEINEILGRLDTEYIDLLQVHWPNPSYEIEETFGALKELKESGRVRYIGVSNFSLEDMKKANEIVEVSSFQGLYNMLEPNATSYHNIGLGYRSEKEIIPYTKENGMMFLPYSPLMQGILAGKGIEGIKDGDVRNSNPVLKEKKYYKAATEIEIYVNRKGYTLLEVALNYLLHMGATTIIASMQNMTEIESNIEAVNKDIPKKIFDDIKNILLKHNIK